MNTKFMDLLNRLFNRIEKDSEKTEQAIAGLRESLHKNELNIKKVAVLPKKTCTARFENVEAKTEEIEKRLPNEREIKTQEAEKEEQKKKVGKISDKIVWLAGGGAGILFVLSVLKYFKVI